jgi:hypothetical protein
MASASVELLSNIDRLYINHFTPQGDYIDEGELVAVFKTEQFAIDFFSQHKDNFPSTLTQEQKQITFKSARKHNPFAYHDPHAIPLPYLKPIIKETVFKLQGLIGEPTVQTLFAQEYARNRQFQVAPEHPKFDPKWKGEW